MSAARQQLGRAGEEHAAARLRAAGARILARNARTRYGEIDLIAVEGRTLCFVEVKTLRTASRAGPERPAIAVGPCKRRRIRRLAMAWLEANRPVPAHQGLRFDVIGLRIDVAGRITEYEHIRAAF